MMPWSCALSFAEVHGHLAVGDTTAPRNGVEDHRGLSPVPFQAHEQAVHERLVVRVEVVEFLALDDVDIQPVAETRVLARDAVDSEDLGKLVRPVRSELRDRDGQHRLRVVVRDLGDAAKTDGHDASGEATTEESRRIEARQHTPDDVGAVLHRAAYLAAHSSSRRS